MFYHLWGVISKVVEKDADEPAPMPSLDFDSRSHPAPMPVTPSAAPTLHAFAVRAEQDPQVMLRIAGLFAQRNIVPHQLCCRTSGPWLLIDVEVACVAPANAQLLLEKIRSIVLVERAHLVEGKV